MNNYSMKYASEKLGVTQQALHFNIEKYEIPMKKVGAKVFISEKNIELLRSKIAEHQNSTDSISSNGKDFMEELHMLKEQLGHEREKKEIFS